MQHSRLFSLLAPLALAATGSSQNEVIYYKFDGNGGPNVINYAPATSPAPEEGTISTTDTASWVSPGKFGIAALRGGGTGGTSIRNFVNTGWNGAFTGSFTAAWFMRQRVAPPSTSYFFATNTFRAFTGGVASTGIWLRAWGGTPADLQLGVNVQALAAADWVHIALVVDTTALVATWYVDGIAQTPIPITGSATVIPGTNNFFVNSNSPTNSSFYDIDEFRFSNSAATPADVLAWSTVNQAADSPYGKGCNAKMDNMGSPPALGNGRYGLTLGGPANAGFALAIGTNRLMLGATPLPLDLGPAIPSLAGCNWETSSDVWLAGATDAGGSATFPLPIPIERSLNGIALFAQALVVARGPAYATTNPFAISIGL